MHNPIFSGQIRNFHLLLFFSICALLIGCQPFKSLEFKGLTDWDLQPKSFAESKLAVNVKLFNPNRHKVVIKGLEADIMVNGKNWSTYTIDSTFEIPENSDFIFPVKLTVKNSHLLSGVSSLAKGSPLPYQFIGKIKGMYRGITASVPFDYSGSFSHEDIKL